MKYLIKTYGCQMNVHDSEKIAGLLQKAGYESTEIDEEADVIVFNTCCIRDTAETKVMGHIGLMKPLKKKKPTLKVVVCGCMTQQDERAQELKNKFPFIDVVVGTFNLERIPVLLEQVDKKTKPTEVFSDITGKRHISECIPTYRTSYPNGWVNIAYGCDNFCTYCIVPYVRGREVSRKQSDVLDEVKKLLDEGYKEITLLGQNVNSYGKGNDDGASFYSLLSEIAKLPGKFRLRFMTSHPKDFNSDIIDVIADSPNICNNIHLPIQSGSNAILKAMNRHYDRERYLSIIDRIHSRIPDCGITTDIMVGFPGETDRDFEDTMDMVRRVRYSNAFCFIYSMRRGTPAAKMEQIPYAIKKERIVRLIAQQNAITKELSAEYLNGTFEVLVEDVAPKKDGYVCGRTDSGRLVTFPGTREMIGSFVDVTITRAQSASLFGKVI